MKRILLGSILVANLLFAKDNIITFQDLSVAVEKLYDNQVLLEKKIVKLENENKNLSQNYTDIKSKIDEIIKNENILNTKLLKLELKIEEKKAVPIITTIEKKDTTTYLNPNELKVIVVTQRAFIRSAPIKQCGNIVRTAKFGEKLQYTQKVEDGNWYQLNDGNYISKLTVREYDKNKKYKMIKSKSKAMECK